jgi:beta-mannosidase
MVWQEFIQSSSGIANKPSEDPVFISMMVREAEIIVPRKRNHASLVLWCGGNELQADDGTPLDNSEPVLKALGEVVARLDPDRHWLPTSPTGRLFMNSIANIEKDPSGLHDVHGPWEHQGLTAHYTLYNKGTSLLHSEFGVEGMTNPKTLNRTISRENQWPAVKDNPIYFHRGAWWINEPLVQAAFDGIETIEKLLPASQFLQYEGLRYAVESNRRRKYQNSGTLPWQFNEPFPNAYCTSAVDYFANPKPVYYGVAAAYEPVHVSASFPTQAWGGWEEFTAALWVSNSRHFALKDVVLDAKLIGSDGELYMQEQVAVEQIPDNRSTLITDIKLPMERIKQNIFFLDLKVTDREGVLLSENRYLYSKTTTLKPMFEVPAANVEASAVKSDGRWMVMLRNTGTDAALNVRLEDDRDLESGGYVYFSDNYFTLLPNEQVTVDVEWSGIRHEQRRIEITGWNIKKMVLGI